MSDNTGLSLKKALNYGVIGGVVGGIVFGIMMQMMGKMGMIASLGGSESLFIGWIFHMIISIVFGIGFGLLATKVQQNLFLLSIIYGVIIWVVGPLLIMPMMMGMGTNIAQMFEQAQLMNLGTHIFYSLIVAFVFKLGTKQEQADTNISA